MLWNYMYEKNINGQDGRKWFIGVQLYTKERRWKITKNNALTGSPIEDKNWVHLLPDQKMWSANPQAKIPQGKIIRAVLRVRKLKQNHYDTLVINRKISNLIWKRNK